MAKLIIDERPFEIGDEVWSWLHGKGFVGDIIQNRVTPISFVKSMGSKESWFYYQDGCFCCDFRTLFHLDVAQELGFIDMEIKITEPFKPEVGELYYRPESNEVLEYVKNNQYYLDSGISVDYSSKHMINAKKISELECIGQEGKIYIENNKHIDEWQIFSSHATDKEEFIFISNNRNTLSIDFTGKAFDLPLKFYRNKHRAERLGGLNA